VHFNALVEMHHACCQVRPSKKRFEGDAVRRAPQRRTLVEHLTLVYGLTRDLTLGVTLPILERRLRFNAPSGERRTIAADGLGDLTLVGAYRLYRRDVERGTTQASFLGGLKLPTGATNIADSDLPQLTGNPETRLPPSLQTGSGSVDGIVGLAAFQNRDRLSFYADV